MLFSKVKDSKLRIKYAKIEYKKKAIKFVTVNLLSKLNIKKKLLKSFILEVLTIKKPYSLLTKVKLVKRCVLNNRSKGVYRSYGLSRCIFRELLQFGVVPGYKKAVW